MTEPTAPATKPFLYVVVCASGIAGDVGTLIAAAQERQWDVGVVATPQGLGFLDVAAVEARTGYPIWNHRHQGPRAHKVGRYLRYRWPEVEAWLEAQAVDRTV